MLQIHAFYGAQYLGNEQTLDDLKTVPDGSYVLMNNKWFHKFHGTLAGINLVDIPKEIQVQLVLLGINK